MKRLEFKATCITPKAILLTKIKTISEEANVINIHIHDHKWCIYRRVTPHLRQHDATEKGPQELHGRELVQNCVKIRNFCCSSFTFNQTLKFSQPSQVLMALFVYHVRMQEVSNI